MVDRAKARGKGMQIGGAVPIGRRMCGRYVNFMSADDIKKVFGIDDVPEFGPKFNQAPGSKSPIVHLDENGKRVCTMMLWGLIPFWSKDGKVKFTSNAWADKVRTSGSFREPFKSRRCIVPVNGFYEWQETPTGKQPFYITLQNSDVMVFAGIYDRWKNPETGEIVQSFAIITCDPNDMIAQLHNRMPVILDESQWDAWLSPETNVFDAEKMLRAYPSELMRRQKVTKKVGNSRNEGPELIKPIDDDDG